MRSPFLWLALVLHVALATAYAWSTPTFEGPDENSHYEYAWHIANAGNLPLTMGLVSERGLPQTDGAVLAHHPPLYYSLVAGAMVAMDRDDTVFAPRGNPKFGLVTEESRRLFYLHEEQPDNLVHWLRMVSVLLGAVTVICVHRLGRACCPDVPRIGDLAAMLTACLPMWSALHGLLNSDVLAATLSAATLLCLVKMLRSERVTTLGGIGLGLLLGLAFLTKLTTLFLGGLAGLVALVLLRRKAVSWVTLGATAATTLLACGWVFWRNYSLYGDPLAMSAHDASFQTVPADLRWEYIFGLHPWPVEAFVPTVFTSLLGRFGWFSQPPNPILIWCGAVIGGIAVLGLLRSSLDKERKYLPHATWLLLLAGMLVFAGTLYFNLSARQPQARLLFPAIAPASILIAAGLVRITNQAPYRKLVLALLPLAAIAAFVTTFLPALDPSLAKAPVDHRNTVGHIVDAKNETIEWTSEPGDAPLAQPPTLNWRDANAPQGTRYTLYAFDDNGRVWLASHEWSKGTLNITGTSAVVPDAAWNMLPKGVPVMLRLRRVPTTATESPADLASSKGLRITRE